MIKKLFFSGTEFDFFYYNYNQVLTFFNCFLLYTQTTYNIEKGLGTTYVLGFPGSLRRTERSFNWG